MTRVAIIYDSLFPINAGGGERVYRRIAELLIERGYEVDYLTRRQWEGTAPETSFAVVPLWEGEIYDRTGSRTIWSAARFAWSVFRMLIKRRNHYDLVISSALPVLTLLAAKAALVGTRSFLIGDWLELWTWRKSRDYSGPIAGTLAFLLQRVAVGVSDFNTADSAFTANRVASVRPQPAPLVHGLVDLVAHTVKSKTPSEPPYILFVGRLIHDKRVAIIPAALLEAQRSIAGLRALIVGTGPEHDAIASEVARLGLNESCELLGRVTDLDLQTLFSGALALVNPSAREGFGLVVAEAAAFGVPSIVVAGEDNAATDLILPGVNGYIAETADGVAISACVVAVYKGGETLRSSTADWFAEARESSGLAASVDAMLERYVEAR